MKINREKRWCLIFNGVEEGCRAVGGISVVEEMRYLGVLVTAKRNCFGSSKGERMNVARRMANMTYSVLVRSSDRLLIGKTFWKSVVLPGVLSANEVLVWTKAERQKLQRIENGVWRKVLRAPPYAPVVALQGEVGCSSVDARDMKSKIKFAKYLMETENVVLRAVFERMRDRGRMCPWMRLVGGYLVELGLGWAELEGMGAKDVVRRVDVWEENRWREELNEKSSLLHYRMKAGIGGETYDNSWGSVLLFRVRSNTLRLGWRARYWGGEVGCMMCGAEEETLKHFLLECPELEGFRGRFGVRTMEGVMSFGKSDTGEICRFLEEVLAARAGSLGEMSVG